MPDQDLQTFEVTSPDGQTLEVTGDHVPTEAELQTIFSKMPKAGPPSLRDAGQAFFEAHPTVAGLARGATSTLPFAGAVLGGVMAPEAPIVAPALGAGIGRGAQDLIDEAVGLHEPSSAVGKALRIGGETALAAGTGGLMEGATNPGAVMRGVARTAGKSMGYIAHHPWYAAAALGGGGLYSHSIPGVASGAVVPLVAPQMEQFAAKLLEYADTPATEQFIRRASGILASTSMADRPAAIEMLEHEATTPGMRQFLADKKTASDAEMRAFNQQVQEWRNDVHQLAKTTAFERKHGQSASPVKSAPDPLASVKSDVPLGDLPLSPEQRAALEAQLSGQPYQRPASMTPTAVRFQASQAPAAAVESPTPVGGLRIADDVAMPPQPSSIRLTGVDIPGRPKVSVDEAIPASKSKQAFGRFSENDVDELGQLLGLRSGEEFALLRKVLTKDGLRGIRPDIAEQFLARRAGRHMDYYEGAKNSAKVREMGEPDVKF